MVNTELAQLEAVERSITKVLTITVVKLEAEIKHISPHNYNSKKKNLLILIEDYLQHLQLVREKVSLNSAKQAINGDILRWRKEVVPKIEQLSASNFSQVQHYLLELVAELRMSLQLVKKSLAEEVSSRRVAV